jgi:hypothetical protein
MRLAHPRCACWAGPSIWVRAMGRSLPSTGTAGRSSGIRRFLGSRRMRCWCPGDGAIYVSTGPKTVYDHVPYVTYALDATSGSVRWQAQDSAVFLVQGAVYAWVHTAGLYPSGITLLDAASGVAQWTYRPNPPLDSTTHLQAPTLANGRLYVGTWDDTAQGATGPLYAHLTRRRACSCGVTRRRVKSSIPLWRGHPSMCPPSPPTAPSPPRHA